MEKATLFFLEKIFKWVDNLLTICYTIPMANTDEFTKSKGPAVFIQIGKYDPKRKTRYQTKFKVLRGVKLEDLREKVSRLIKELNG